VHLSQKRKRNGVYKFQINYQAGRVGYGVKLGVSGKVEDILV